MAERTGSMSNHDMKQKHEHFNYPNILGYVAVALVLWGLFTFFASTVNSHSQNEIDYKVRAIIFHPLWVVGLLSLIVGMVADLWVLEKHGKKKHDSKTEFLITITVLVSFVSAGSILASYYHSGAPSCFRIMDGKTQYENDHCVYKTRINYVEQTIEVKNVSDTVVRRDGVLGFVEGKEYTVTAGVFDGKEYKDGDTIFVANQNGKYGVVSDRREDTISDVIGSASSVTGGASVEKMRLGIIRSYVYKQDVESISGKFIDDGHGTPHSISIDGREYVDTGKLNKESRNPRGELVTSHEQVYMPK